MHMRRRCRFSAVGSSPACPPRLEPSFSGDGFLDRASTSAQTDQMTVSGGGVNLKPMPSPDGKGTVPLRELFTVDAHYAQCVIEDNPARFAMDTFAMGRVVIEPHTFFMAMYANEVSLVGVYDAGRGQAPGPADRGARLRHRGGDRQRKSRLARGDRAGLFRHRRRRRGTWRRRGGRQVSFTVSFDAKQAPVNHAIFGDKATFTGEMIAGEITIAAPVTLPFCQERPRQARRPPRRSAMPASEHPDRFKTGGVNLPAGVSRRRRRRRLGRCVPHAPPRPRRRFRTPSAPQAPGAPGS